MQKEMPIADGYQESAPQVRDHVEKYEQALESVRRTHGGQPVSEVLGALTAAFEAEGIEVWSEVAADSARLISELHV